MRPAHAIALIGRVVDAVSASLVLVAAALELVWWSCRPRRGSTAQRVLLLMDGAYSLEAVRRRGIEHALTSQDLDGYFSMVWHVHPLVGADPHEISSDTSGTAQETELAPGHRVIEGHPSIWRTSRLPLTGFALAQADLLHRVHRAIGSSGVDVIRVGDPYYLGLIGLGLARCHRVPLVIRINGNYDAIYESVGQLAYPRLFKRRWIEKRIDHFVLRRADLIAGANENNLGFALENGGRPERGAIFRYGALVDPAHFTDPAQRAGVEAELGLGDRPYTVTVSRLEPVKRTEDVLHAVARLRNDHPELSAVVIGDGSERRQLERLTRELKIEDAVVFTGERDQAWIARALARASVLVAPSAGRALVEAALAGIPLVVYDVDWHRELIADDDNGYLVPLGDRDGLVAAVHRVLTDSDLASRLGDRARESALDMMDPERLIAVQRDAYDRLLSVRRGEDATT